MSELTTFVKALSESTGLPEKKIREIVRNLPDALLKTLKEEGSLTLRNLMRLKIVNRPPTRGRNPQTGESIFIPARKSVSTKFSKTFLENINTASAKCILYFGQDEQIFSQLEDFLVGWDLKKIADYRECSVFLKETHVDVSAIFFGPEVDHNEYKDTMKFIKGSESLGLTPIITLGSYAEETSDGGSLTVYPDLALDHPPSTPDDLNNFVSTVESAKADSEFFLSRILVEATGHESALSELISFSKDVLFHFFSKKDEEKREHFLNSITEAVNNAFYHGNEADEQKKIKLSIVRDPKQISVTIEDQGQGFSYKSYLEGSAEDKSGLGISVIKSGTDRVKYTDKGRKITLIKII